MNRDNKTPGRRVISVSVNFGWFLPLYSNLPNDHFKRLNMIACRISRRLIYACICIIQLYYGLGSIGTFLLFPPPSYFFPCKTNSRIQNNNNNNNLVLKVSNNISSIETLPSIQLSFIWMDYLLKTTGYRKRAGIKPRLNVSLSLLYGFFPFFSPLSLLSIFFFLTKKNSLSSSCIGYPPNNSPIYLFFHFPLALAPYSLLSIRAPHHILFTSYFVRRLLRESIE